MYVELIINELIDYWNHPVFNNLICNIIFKANSQLNLQLNYNDSIISNADGGANKDGDMENSQIITISDLMNNIQHLGHVLINGNYYPQKCNIKIFKTYLTTYF